MIHDKARVEAIRARVASQIALIQSLEAKIANGKLDSLEVARNQTNDIETLYLQNLEAEDRNPAEDARWLSYAEQMLQTWGPSLKQTEQQLAKFGGHEIEVIGG